MKTAFKSVKSSLSGLVGNGYAAAVTAACARLTGRPARDARRIADTPVEFFPAAFNRVLVRLLPEIGTPFSRRFGMSRTGASSGTFNAATHTAMAPLSCLGYYRVAEDGRLHCATKSEHYHTSVGHAFPGYRLVEYAKLLGMPNATHNNTRGHVTRLLEEELVCAANGIDPADRAAVRRALAATGGGVLNRVLNLETGSLAAEAAVKMMLARFYRVQPGFPRPKYADRTPVFLVLGDDDGGLHANYHGTTMITQMLRGMWPGMREELERHNVLRVVALRPNCIGDLEAAFRNYDKGTYKIAGLCHELIMMNYAARVVSKTFIRRAYQLCRAHDVPTFVDEIQSCMWSPELLLYREYGLRPSMVALGKGFPGGEYPASRILFTAEMDCLPQFGALVTNGQEELASLAYLITMRWARENRDVTRAVGEYYEKRLRALARAHPGAIHSVAGIRHLCGLCFHDLDTAKAFAAALVRKGFDISVQTYKSDCPPAALTKLPLIAGYELVDVFIDAMADVLSGTRGRRS
ncbi:aminotransferase class III-fold pyridoxal phosphate-dependent enzyme [bacterium]|nr:aminotransferase class III-fold pyridoxal phosphate-dependent enzyme [bacterium]